MRLLFVILLLAINVTHGADRFTNAFKVRVLQGSSTRVTGVGNAELARFDALVWAAGHWDSLACWPMLSSQNSGTGTILYSLGGRGTFNVTLVGSPTWGLTGLDFTSGAGQTAQTSFPINSQNWMLGYVGNLTSFAGNGDGMGFDVGGSYCVLSWSGVRLLIIEQDGGTVGPATGETTGSWQAIFGARTQGGDVSTGRRAFKNGALNASLSSSGGTMTYPHSVFKVINSSATTTRAFGFVINANITTQQAADFYTIYKTTLGRRLGLP